MKRKFDRENLKKLLARAENIADGDGLSFLMLWEADLLWIVVS